MTFSLLPALAAGLLLAATAEERGKEIYLSGTSPSGGEITASLGADATGLPGAALTCAGCHGQDGRGKREGGIEPPDITWQSLTKSYGHRHADGREHPAYTARSVGRAIVMGTDPAGNSLGVAMPRYSMTARDLGDLVAYLQRVGRQTDRGMTDRTIRIGAVVPGRGPLAKAGREIEAVLGAWFEELNARSGINGRRLQLRVLRDDGRPLAPRLQRFLAGEGVFALLDARALAADQEIAGQAEASEVPTLVPLAAFPGKDAAAHRHVFYLLSGLEDQARALVDFAAARLGAANPRVAIVYPQVPALTAVADAMEAECKHAGCSSATRIGYTPGTFGAAAVASDLKAGRAQVVCFLGSGSELESLLAATAGAAPAPTFLLAGALTGQEVFDAPDRSESRIFVGYPMLPSEESSEGLDDFRALAKKKGLSREHVPLQISAYGAARVLVEGLRRAGRDLSREKLVGELEALYEFDSGLFPPLTFGPNRRVGASGAYVVAVDRARRRYVPVGGWMAAK
jgi:ABC-type branched-subunit amino acid transport system substrate-binding protein